MTARKSDQIIHATRALERFEHHAREHLAIADGDLGKIHIDAHSLHYDFLHHGLDFPSSIFARAVLLALFTSSAFWPFHPFYEEQPHVLDRDHRLVGEGLDQLDLFLGESSRL